MDRWKRIQAEIEDFRRYLYAHFPILKIKEGYDFAWGQDLYKQSRKDKRYGQPGVYLFFDGAGQLLYVGKAIYTFDKRIWAHADIPGVRFIDLIPFDDKHAPFLLALEQFLICRLKPPFNTHGKDYTLPRMP